MTRRALLFVAFLLATASVLRPQTTAGDAWMAQFRKTNPDLAQLVEMSSAVRPELGAKMLLTIAGSPRVKQRQAKRKFLVQAFETAALVREPLPQDSILSGNLGALSTIGTHLHLQQTLRWEELDRLSLETSAVSQMLTVDPGTAKELFLSMPSPVLNRPTCADVLVQDPSAYYILLARIIQGTFRTKERQDGRHAELLSQKIKTMGSPLDLAYMVEALRSAPLSIDERSQLTTEFSVALGNMELDDRSFSFSLQETDERLHGLIAVLASEGAGTEVLVAAYRSYLARGFSEARCADTMRNIDDSAKVVARFNSQLARDGDTNLRRFESTDLKPATVLGEPELPSITPSVQELIERILDLNAARREGDDWRAADSVKREGIVRMFEEIEPAVGEDQDSYLMRKGMAFAGTIESLSPGTERDKLLLRYVDFVTYAANRSQDLLVWIGPLRMLMDDIDSDAAASRALLDLLRNSTEASVSFYAKLEQLRRANAASVPVTHGSD